MIEHKAAHDLCSRSVRPPTCQNRGPGRLQAGWELRSVVGAGDEEHHCVSARLRRRVGTDRRRVGTDPDLPCLGNLVNRASKATGGLAAR
jgi:hypothetical protein